MHASVQHKPFTSHSMFIKVASGFLRHSKNWKWTLCDSWWREQIWSVFATCTGIFGFVQKSPPLWLIRLHSNSFFKPALAWPCRKSTQKTDTLYSNCQKKVQTFQQSLVCVSVCLCLCVRVSVWWLTVKAIKHFWQKDYNVQQLQWSTRWQKAETKLSM